MVNKIDRSSLLGGANSIPTGVFLNLKEEKKKERRHLKKKKEIEEARPKAGHG